MPLQGLVFTAPHQTRGFDADFKIGPKLANRFGELGYRFAVRYVRRDPVNARDLSANEAGVILDAGLGLMPVQHVESESSWNPTEEKGRRFGRNGAEHAQQIGIPEGVTLWCDLEGVAVGTAPAQVSAYGDAWYQAVWEAGYVPGLYVGFHAVLGPEALFDLRFRHYWGAFNLNKDEEPATRGLQMKQRESKDPALVPTGLKPGDFQIDFVRTDALGGRPTLVAPANWLG
jgi:hypothetical protein